MLVKFYLLLLQRCNHDWKRIASLVHIKSCYLNLENATKSCYGTNTSYMLVLVQNALQGTWWICSGACWFLLQGSHDHKNYAISGNLVFRSKTCMDTLEKKFCLQEFSAINGNGCLISTPSTYAMFVIAAFATTEKADLWSVPPLQPSPTPWCWDAGPAASGWTSQPGQKGEHYCWPWLKLSNDVLSRWFLISQFVLSFPAWDHRWGHLRRGGWGRHGRGSYVLPCFSTSEVLSTLLSSYLSLFVCVCSVSRTLRILITMRWRRRNQWMARSQRMMGLRRKTWPSWRRSGRTRGRTTWM